MWIPMTPSGLSGCDTNRQLALQAARETITLLKNENDLAAAEPRRKSKPSRSSARMRTASCWAATAACPNTTSRVLEGIKAKVGDRVQVLYREGCKITVGGSWNQDEVVAPDPAEDRPQQIAEAVKSPNRPTSSFSPSAATSRLRAKPGPSNTWATAPASTLIGRQEELVAAMVATGKPVIVLLFNGRPLSINYAEPTTCPRFSNAGISARKPATPWRTFCSAIATPAESCPSPFPARPAICRRFTTTNPRPAAAICSTSVTPLYPVRLRPELHDLRLQKRPAGKEEIRARPIHARPRGCEEHRQTRRHRSGANVYSRLCQFRHAAREGIEGFQKIVACAGRKPDRRA